MSLDEPQGWNALVSILEDIDRWLEDGQQPPERNEPDGRMTSSIHQALKNTVRSEITQETITDVLSLSSKTLLKLIARIKIDSKIYYNPRELESTAELIQTQLDSAKLLERNVRLISSLTDIVEAMFDHQIGDEHEILLGSCFEDRCETIYRLACWCSVGYSNDEWDLEPGLEKIISTTIDRLWRIPYSIENVPVRGWNINLEIAYTILEKHVKPLFTAQQSFSRHLNPYTGRKLDLKEEHLFGPISDSLDEPAWKLEGIGFWNAMCILLDRLHHDPGLKEIWHLMIPPMITLVESTIPRYRLRGIQLSICLLRNVQPLIICQTGINSILQNAFSTTFGLLNIQQTYRLLHGAFDATKLLIEVEWNASQQTPKDQAKRYLQLNQLIEQSIFNALTFGKAQGQPGQLELHQFAVARFIDVTRELGYGIGRYIRVIVPYLCETLLTLTLSRSSYTIVIQINKLLKLLFEICEELLVEWRSRLVVVYGTCWLEWRGLGQESESGRSADEDHGPMLSDLEIETVRQSIIEDTLRSFVRLDGVPGDERTGDRDKLGDGQKQEKSEELLELIRTVQDTDPLLNELFGPLFSSF